jgi:hypothetical protein
MNKLLDRLLNLFKGNKKTAAADPQPRPKVKRQNAVPTIKTVDNKTHKAMPKKHTVDKKVHEAKKNTGEVKAEAGIDKPKKKKYYRYKHKKSTPAAGKGRTGNKEK